MNIKGVRFKLWHLAGIGGLWFVMGRVMWPLNAIRFITMTVLINALLYFCGLVIKDLEE